LLSTRVPAAPLQAAADRHWQRIVEQPEHHSLVGNVVHELLDHTQALGLGDGDEVLFEQSIVLRVMVSSVAPRPVVLRRLDLRAVQKGQQPQVVRVAQQLEPGERGVAPRGRL